MIREEQNNVKLNFRAYIAQYMLTLVMIRRGGGGRICPPFQESHLSKTPPLDHTLSQPGKFLEYIPSCKKENFPNI